MNIEQSIVVLKSLADISRMRIISILKIRPHYVEEIAKRLELAVSTVSFHLKKMERAGLVHSRKEQYYIVYSLNEGLLQTTLGELLDCNDIEIFQQEKRIRDYREKVLGIFFKDGKLSRMPVQKKKRLIILDKFAALFEPGRKYSEQEINRCILQYYEDYCMIRRLLVEEGYMERSSQSYKKI